MSYNLDSAAPPISVEELENLRKENDALEQTIHQHTKKFDIKEDVLPQKTVTMAPPKPEGVNVIKFNVLPQFAEEAMRDRGTPYTPIQCKNRGHDGTMFTS